MKIYDSPFAIVVGFDPIDILCASKGFTSDDDVFDEASGEGSDSSSGGGSYDLPIV